MGDRKEALALSILEGALLLFPPLARVIAKAFGGHAIDESDAPLVAKVLERLPVDGESERALRDLEAGHAD